MNPFRLAGKLSTAPRSRPASSPPGVIAAGTAVGDPGSGLVPRPVEVPWRVVRRTDRGVVEIEQCGEGPLRSARFALAGAGLLGLSLPRTVYPGERLSVVLRGVYVDEALTAPDAMLVLRWF